MTLSTCFINKDTFALLQTIILIIIIIIRNIIQNIFKMKTGTSSSLNIAKVVVNNNNKKQTKDNKKQNNNKNNNSSSRSTSSSRSSSLSNCTARGLCTTSRAACVPPSPEKVDPKNVLLGGLGPFKGPSKVF